MSEDVKMADNRFNQAPGFGSNAGFHVGQQSPSMNGLPGMSAYIPGGMPVNPMIQQQMMMASRMRSPMQGMMMGIPATPPPPYSAHTPNPGVTTIPNRPRTLLSKSKDGQQSEKERYFEEQRQKLRLFGKPGTVKVDADKLIGTMFAADTKTQQSKAKSKTQNSQEDDDGFGDFLQGPSLPTNTTQKDKKSVQQQPQTTIVEETPAPKLESSHERKDLKSMMLEYSDLSAPKKAKGFHKLTLNEVHKSGHSHHKVTNFHESDHSRSWKQNTEDLEGLFNIPVTPKPSAIPVNTVSPETQHLAYTPQQVMAAGLSPTGMAAFTPGYQVLSSPSGQPPSYSDVVGAVTMPVSHTAMFTSPVAVSHTGSSDAGHSSAKATNLPGWCSHEEDQLPPVYKQIYEASVIEGKISTERLYPILLLSGLPREKLAQIWSLCNTTMPGQLTKHELWLVLAFIALTQNNYDSSSRDIIARCPVAPVPFFAQMQDTNAPATLPIGLQQHQSHPPNPSTTTLATSPTSAHAVLPSHTPHQKQQFHRVQHSKPLPHKVSSQMPADVTTSKNAGTTDEDDDFADFQAAAPNTNTAAVSIGKDEVFGEFIGGGVGSSGFSLCPVTGPVQMGNGSVVMGNGSLQCHHQPNQQQLQQSQEGQQQSQPAPLLLASLPVDDKYGTNVRSFFCSSDSSTGHTSPSFEDDDFTDGRDSLSQVSTSEQSENEDIRNFENYVEEYNQQLEKPRASPLHCPFPALQQNQTVVGAMRTAQQLSHAPFAGVKHSDKSEGMSKFDLNASSLGQIPGSEHINISVGLSHHHIGQNLAPSDLKNPVSTLKMASAGTSTGVGTLKNIKELAYSKSAFLHVSSSDMSASNEVSLIGDEDKYSALRVLSLDNDFSQHSTFKVQGHISEYSATSNSHESNQAQNPESLEDDWADFSTAPIITDDEVNHISSLASAPGTNSNLEAPTDSMFEDNTSSNTTPSKGWGLDFSLSGDRFSPKTTNDCDSFSTVTDTGGDGRYHRSDYTGHVTNLNHVRIPEMDTSDFAANSEFSSKLCVVPSDKSDLYYKLKCEENSEQLSHTSATNSVSFGKFPQSLAGRGDINKVIDGSCLNVKSSDEDDDWCDFSSAGMGDGAGSTDEVVSGDGKGKFVTIKKQNLGTSEIMGLFKVRDDPATLSSYQLPLQQQASKMASSQSQSTNMGTSSFHRPRRSSDFDDDLGPPPMDMCNDDDYDDHSYSRGYDLDDFMQQIPTTTTYNPFGGTHTSPLYSCAGGLGKLKENKEDSGSVHSLDLPSSRPTNRSSSDSQSVSSADLASAEMTGAGVVSVESKSLDSLDLRSDNGDGDSIDGGTREGVQQTLGPTSYHQPIQPQELLATMPDFADRYNIEREAQGSDRYGYEWERCLSNCCRMISEANTLFNMIDSSSVCNEVLKSSQGSEYVMCIVEIYRVVCRVLTSMRVTAISTTELEQTLKNIDIAWNNLSAFLAATSLLPEQTSLVFTNCILKADSDLANSVACGLCLLNVDAKPLTSLSQQSGTSNISNCKLTYAGRQYHATCANFWVNCVDQTLPSLTLSELL